MTKLMSREHAKDVATQLSRKRLEAGGGIAKGARQVAGEHGSRAADGRHGCIVERGLLQALRSELGELLVAGRKAINLSKDGHLRSLSAWRANARGPGCMLSTRARASWA